MKCVNILVVLKKKLLYVVLLQVLNHSRWALRIARSPGRRRREEGKSRLATPRTASHIHSRVARGFSFSSPPRRKKNYVFCLFRLQYEYSIPNTVARVSVFAA